MAIPARLSDPAIQAKRKHNGKFVALVTNKAVEWGRANGYTELLVALDNFMLAYRQAQTKPNYYDQQTPESLLTMIRQSQARMEKAMAALQAKNGNGHAS